MAAEIALWEIADLTLLRGDIAPESALPQKRRGAFVTAVFKSSSMGSAWPMAHWSAPLQSQNRADRALFHRPHDALRKEKRRSLRSAMVVLSCW